MNKGFNCNKKPKDFVGKAMLALFMTHKYYFETEIKAVKNTVSLFATA